MNKRQWVRENEGRPEFMQKWPNYKQRVAALEELFDRTGGDLPKPTKKKTKKKTAKKSTK